ncbi:MAG TPA: hypothetical protein PLQ35_15965 [bacterium]|nr:hypothetical protein [bacterium]HQL63777.1 hypothetical protein [bacterium]
MNTNVLIDDVKRCELVIQALCSYIVAFNGPDMRPPDAITCARYVEQLTDSLDRLYPRPKNSGE